MSIQTEALVLRRFDFGETSQTGRLYTRELGRISVLAKGIKRPGPALRGPLDLFALAAVEIRLRRRSDLHLLARYRVRTGFRGTRQSLARLGSAFYVTEILREGTRDQDPDPRLFDLACATLAALELASAAQVQALMAHFELRYLDLAGFRPRFEACAICQREAPPTGRVRYSHGRCGLICRSCASGRPGELISLSPALRSRLQGLQETQNPAAVLGLSVPSEERAALGRLLPAILERVLEKELKSAPFVAGWTRGSLGPTIR